MRDLALRCYNNIEVHDKYGRVVNRADKMDGIVEMFVRPTCFTGSSLRASESLFKDTTISAISSTCYQCTRRVHFPCY